MNYSGATLYLSDGLLGLFRAANISWGSFNWVAARTPSIVGRAMLFCPTLPCVRQMSGNEKMLPDLPGLD